MGSYLKDIWGAFGGYFGIIPEKDGVTRVINNYIAFIYT